MPIFRTQVFYKRGAQGKWSNVWHNEAADIPTLQAAWSSTGIPDLQPMLDSSAVIERFLISDLDGDLFVSTNVNAAGTSTASGDTLPLFNSVKVLFSDGGLGRPDLKYMKGLVTESVQTDGELSNTFQAAVDVLMTTLLNDMAGEATPFTSITGDEYVSASVQPAVQMRQMHRKRKKSVPA